MNTQYPRAHCGCVVEVYGKHEPVCRMDCSAGARLVNMVMAHAEAGRTMPDSLVIEYNRHVAVAVESVMRERAA